MCLGQLGTLGPPAGVASAAPIARATSPHCDAALSLRLSPSSRSTTRSAYSSTCAARASAAASFSLQVYSSHAAFVPFSPLVPESHALYSAVMACPATPQQLGVGPLGLDVPRLLHFCFARLHLPPQLAQERL